MKIIKLDAKVSREELLETINNYEFVNDKVQFDENKGKPKIHVKDNGFLEGTYFLGTLKESNSTTQVRGIILTAPIYHTLLALLTAFYVIYSAMHSAFNPVPLILLIFSIFMFKGEFDKQGTIERYLHRAIKRAEIKKNTQSK